MNQSATTSMKCQGGVKPRAVNRRPYEPYVRYRHMVPSAVPVDFWNCDYRSRYTAGSQPYFAVLWRPFTAVRRVTILKIISCKPLCTNVLMRAKLTTCVCCPLGEKLWSFSGGYESGANDFLGMPRDIVYTRRVCLRSSKFVASNTTLARMFVEYLQSAWLNYIPDTVVLFGHIGL